MGSRAVTVVRLLQDPAGTLVSHYVTWCCLGLRSCQLRMHKTMPLSLFFTAGTGQELDHTSYLPSTVILFSPSKCYDLINVYTMFFSSKWESLCDLLLQAERGPCERLWEGRRIQDHHAHHISRGSISGLQSLWEELSVCPFCLQTTGLQMAQEHSLQGACSCYSNCLDFSQLIMSLSEKKNIS